MQVLSLVTSRGGVDRSRAVLGPVQLDGGASLGTVGRHLVDSYGFSQGCIVVPFTTPNAASALAYPLAQSLLTITEPSAIVCLSVDDADSITLPASEFVAGLGWTATPNPAKNFTDRATDNPSKSSYLITLMYVVSISAGCMESADVLVTP